LLDLGATAAACSNGSIAPNAPRVTTPLGWRHGIATWDDCGVTQRADDRPPARPRGIHIPPEEAVFLVMLGLDVIGTLWQQQRSKWAMQKLTMSRSLEYALGHEGGFTSLMRQARLKRR
jgi:hypothetical protein